MPSELSDFPILPQKIGEVFFKLQKRGCEWSILKLGQYETKIRRIKGKYFEGTQITSGTTGSLSGSEGKLRGNF